MIFIILKNKILTNKFKNYKKSLIINKTKINYKL